MRSALGLVTRVRVRGRVRVRVKPPSPTTAVLSSLANSNIRALVRSQTSAKGLVEANHIAIGRLQAALMCQRGLRVTTSYAIRVVVRARDRPEGLRVTTSIRLELGSGQG